MNKMLFEIIPFLIQRVRQIPSDYVCIGCDRKVSDHETVFETRAMRLQRHAAVDEDFRPLMDFADREAVLNPELGLDR